MLNIKQLLVYLINLKSSLVVINNIINTMCIARLSNFDLIIGNPPWAKLEKLPLVYVNKLKQIESIKDLFAVKGQFGGTQLNLCAVISFVTASNWLNKNGKLSFLMPDNIMAQYSYEKFRDFYINQDTCLYLQKVDKWVAPLRPFSSEGKTVTQDFNTYYFGFDYQDYKTGIPVQEITVNKNLNNDIIQLSDLKITNNYALQLSNNSTSFSYKDDIYDFSKIIGSSAYLCRSGVEFTPKEVFLLNAFEKSIKGQYKFKKYFIEKIKI